MWPLRSCYGKVYVNTVSVGHRTGTFAMLYWLFVHWMNTRWMDFLDPQYLSLCLSLSFMSMQCEVDHLSDCSHSLSDCSHSLSDYWVIPVTNLPISLECMYRTYGFVCSLRFFLWTVVGMDHSWVYLMTLVVMSFQTCITIVFHLCGNHQILTHTHMVFSHWQLNRYHANVTKSQHLETFHLQKAKDETPSGCVGYQTFCLLVLGTCSSLTWSIAWSINFQVLVFWYHCSDLLYVYLLW